MSELSFRPDILCHTIKMAQHQLYPLTIVSRGFFLAAYWVSDLSGHHLQVWGAIFTFLLSLPLSCVSKWAPLSHWALQSVGLHHFLVHSGVLKSVVFEGRLTCSDFWKLILKFLLVKMDWGREVREVTGGWLLQRGGYVHRKMSEGKPLFWKLTKKIRKGGLCDGSVGKGAWG